MNSQNESNDMFSSELSKPCLDTPLTHRKRQNNVFKRCLSLFIDDIFCSYRMRWWPDNTVGERRLQLLPVHNWCCFLKMNRTLDKNKQNYFHLKFCNHSKIIPWKISSIWYLIASKEQSSGTETPPLHLLCRTFRSNRTTDGYLF